jgi:hypothetical protein
MIRFWRLFYGPPVAALAPQPAPSTAGEPVGLLLALTKAS